MIDAPYQEVVMSAERWREVVEPGLYRRHSTTCPSSADHQPRRRCQCPWTLVVLTAEPGRTRQISFRGTKTEAKLERRRLSAERRPADHRAPVASVRALIAEWFRVGETRWSPATLADRDRAYRTRIDPRFGELAPEEVTHGAVEAWAADLIVQGHGRRAVELAVQTLRAFLGTLCGPGGRLTTNPAAKVVLPPPPPRDRTPDDRVLPRAGCAVLLETASKPRRGGRLGRKLALCHKGIASAALEAGLRRGEIAGLTWPDALLAERRLVIRQQIYQSKKTGTIVRRAKGDAEPKRVGISEAFARLLADWYAVSVIEGGADSTGYVWPGRDGRSPMSPSSLTHLIQRLGVRAGLVDHKGRHIAHLHGLRHTAGSLALDAGVSLPSVQAQLRHSRMDFTARVYAHKLSDEALDRFAAGAQTLPPTLPREATTSEIAH